jgi:hypothetical protein
MECTATTRTDATLNVECHVLARQMVRKRLSPRSRFKISLVDRGGRRSLRPCDISVEVFQSERKLVTVEPFRSSSELRALQTLNDQPETLDLGPCLHKLGSVTCCLSDQLAHQPMQRIGVGGEHGEIEIHAGEFNAGAQQHPPQSLS